MPPRIEEGAWRQSSRAGPAVERAGHTGLPWEGEGAGLVGIRCSQLVAIPSWTGSCAGLIAGNFGELGGRIMEGSALLLTLFGGPEFWQGALKCQAKPR